jgi:D-alanyl-lipoteichoic acid acyltransferase DltB (MBOAT superfamily)
MDIFSPILIPALVGFVLIGSASFLFVPVGPFRSRSEAQATRIPRVVNSLILLIAQLVLLRFFAYATSTSLLVAVVVLSAIAVSANAYLRGWKGGLVAAGIYFAVFLGYWIAQKYLFSPAFLPFVEKLSSRVSFVDGEMKLIAIAGTSYIGFKLIHFMVDVRSGEIEKVDPLEFLSWLLFFPSILAGPMMRFQDWVEQREKAVVDFASIVEGAQRILVGLFMKLAIADVVYSGTIAQMSVSGLQQATLLQIAQGCALYTVYLFFDFAGYSHIAIGVGLFWGIRLPENFNKPYIARNLAEFWNRWHISLSTILRDFLFYPLTLSVKRSPFFKGQVIVPTMLAPFLTFLVAGVWHGAGVNFVIYGALHGIGLGIVSVLKQRRNKGAFTLWWEKSLVGRAGGIAITFSYVSFTFLFFALPWSSLVLLLGRLKA